MKRVLLTACLLLSLPAFSQTTVVIGFLGGFVPANETHHPEVQLVQEMNSEHPEIAYALFSNHQVDDAYRMILALDPNHKARIVLFGHSWGGAAAVDLCRQLNKAGIPVDSIALVDSVAKPFHHHDDRRVPANVRFVLNVYQTEGRIHGRNVFADNPSATSVENALWHPLKREHLPWRGRCLSHGHAEIEFDPRVWQEVRRLILDTPAKSSSENQEDRLPK